MIIGTPSPLLLKQLTRGLLRRFRFDMIIAKGIQEIDIWKTPIPDNMWKFIAKFVYSDTFASSA
jgi:hypothetical protein